MSKRILKITGDAARRAACGYVQQAPEGYVVTIAEPTRNLEQSAKFHAICGEIAKLHKFAGALRTPEQWKMLLISGHAVATKQGSEMLPGLEGEWCNLRESSAKMSVRRMASLIEYAVAYCAENDILLPLSKGDLHDIDVHQGLHGVGIQQANRSAICSDERRAR